MVARANGVGPKLAERIVRELKDKAGGITLGPAAAAQVALIAPEGEQWDELLLVRYPSKAAFLGMLADPEYRAATVHRTAALADSRLIGCLPPG